jgi:hypothetical protein
MAYFATFRVMTMKSSECVLAIFSVFLTVTFANQARADECDPTKILMADSVNKSIDIKAVLIPGSAELVTPVRRVSSGGIFNVLPGSKTYDPKKVCRTASAYDTGTNGVDIGVCGYLVAAVLVRIPRENAKSKYADQPPYAVDPATVCKGAS